MAGKLANKKDKHESYLDHISDRTSEIDFEQITTPKGFAG